MECYADAARYSYSSYTVLLQHYVSESSFADVNKCDIPMSSILDHGTNLLMQVIQPDITEGPSHLSPLLDNSRLSFEHQENPNMLNPS